MKTTRTIISALFLMLVMLCFAYPTHAQDVTAAEGGYSAAAVFPEEKAWSVTYTSRLTISGVGSYSDVTNGSCVFRTNGSFQCFDYVVSKEYPGTYSINKGNQKFSKVKINNQAKNDLKDVIEDWTRNIAFNKGASSVRNISVKFGKITIIKPKYNPSNLKPNAAVLKISGNISATVDNVRMTRGFNYRSKLVFSSF